MNAWTCGQREPLLSATELAEVLGVQRRWIYDQVEQHEMPAYRPPAGRKLLFELSAVEAWLRGFRLGDWSASKPCVDPDSAAGIPNKMQDLQVG